MEATHENEDVNTSRLRVCLEDGDAGLWTVVSYPTVGCLPFYEFFSKVEIPLPGVSGDSWVRGLPFTKYQAEEEQAL